MARYTSMSPLNVLILETVQYFKSDFVSDKGCGQIHLIFPAKILLPNLNLDRSLVSFSFYPTHLLCSTSASSQVFLGLHLFIVPFTLKSHAYLGFLNTRPHQQTLFTFASRSIVYLKSKICIRFLSNFLST